MVGLGAMPGYGIQSMLKEGHHHLSGLDEAVLKNIDACGELSAITRTSIGPNGELRSLSCLLPLFGLAGAGWAGSGASGVGRPRRRATSRGPPSSSTRTRRGLAGQVQLQRSGRWVGRAGGRSGGDGGRAGGSAFSWCFELSQGVNAMLVDCS
ncbi:hypothetical protein PVAP13_8KG284329 [Panicum virgatum]|uniref:Uncharacterized protein n=1 Tax=Panicum virgatum TaxID=38727 RepID=A0A8T0PQI2_PANVG|nr:hypothetical protein PVAP13_8KG284329 [Panicum virgatum]